MWRNSQVNQGTPGQTAKRPDSHAEWKIDFARGKLTQTEIGQAVREAGLGVFDRGHLILYRVVPDSDDGESA